MAKDIIIKRLEGLPDIRLFQHTFNKVLGYSTVPLEYFMRGECYGMFDRGELVAGFCLVDGFWSLRAVRQMPADKQTTLARGLRNFGLTRMSDFTGFFIKDRKYTIKFLWYLAGVCWRHRSVYFIYSYQTTEYGLERYYRAGKPLRVHTGSPEHLPGHHDKMEPEHVEILTKMGIIKIVASRTIKLIFKR